MNPKPANVLTIKECWRRRDLYADENDQVMACIFNRIAEGLLHAIQNGPAGARIWREDFDVVPMSIDECMSIIESRTSPEEINLFEQVRDSILFYQALHDPSTHQAKKI